MNKNIIIAILIVIIIAVAVFMFVNPTAKLDTQINNIGNSTIQNGELVVIELKDSQGNPVANQPVNITFNNQHYSVVTDSNGRANLLVYGVAAGSYEVSVDYGGNDKYNACNAKFSITVEDGAADNPAPSDNGSSIASTISSDSNTSGLHYSSRYGVYYDDNGIIRSGQMDGMNINNLGDDPYQGIN